DNAKRIEIDLNTEIADHFAATDPDNPAFFEFLMNFENVVGTDFDDEIRGSADDNKLEGGEGDDFIHGRRGDDTLLGNQGDDTLEGGLGNDILKGGKGDDTLFGGHGANNGLVLGGDILFGGDGDDTLFAGEGNNEAFGGEGDDLILPDLDGVDDPTGVFSNNLVATGGADSDTFVFVDGISSTSLRITDFDDTEDFIEFRGIERPGGWLTPNIGRAVTDLDDLDTVEDGIITTADFGWELTTDGTGLKFTTNDGASLVIEGVTSFDADALIIG
ncbi:MAG: calcium-binding protein, partial [Boseongicola sp.]